MGIHPKTKNIAVVSGSAPSDKAQTDKTRLILQEGYTDFNIIYLTDIPMDEIIEKVSILPDNTIILYLVFSCLSIC